MSGLLSKGSQQGMRINGKPSSQTSGLSDDEDAVQSGSATGFSDGELDETSSRPQRSSCGQFSQSFDPVNSILDKIDAELVSLTKSHNSSSATDSTVIHRPGSRLSQDLDGMEREERLSISQLRENGHPHNSFSPQSTSSRLTKGSDKDTGFGSLHDDSQTSLRSPSMSQKRSRSLEARFRSGGSPDDTDDKSSPRPTHDAGETLEAKQVDDKFKELMQKRKGGSLLESLKHRGGHQSNDDAETIRTEDFADRFHDTLVYSSDEAERLKNLEDDLSDGGFDTDTIQQRLNELTSLKLPPDARSSQPRQTRGERSRRKLRTSNQSFFKKGSPGTPPTYPKQSTEATLPTIPRPTTIVRPASGGRGGIKLTGHTSDADSVKTEDFESRFQEIMTPPTGESDLDTASSDPIHTRVRELLKATAKYKPKTEPYRAKQHVRISSSPPQYKDEDKGDDSDGTLCSDKEDSARSDKHPDDTDSIAETRQEIARESARIRKEMEKERRAKSSSPVRQREDRSPTRTYLTLTASPRQMEEGEKARRSLSDEEKEHKAELRITQDALQITQKALLEAQKQLKETQAQLEDERTQLMLMEYKKDNTNKELSRVTENLSLKKKQVKSYENQVRSRMDEIKQFDSIGFTKEEAVQIIEANEKMKNRLRNLDAVHLERDELIHQLETSKQELFHEQKTARNKIEELKEELENTTSQYEQVQTEKDDLVKKVNKLETRFRIMEKEKNELIQSMPQLLQTLEKTKLYDEERDKSRNNQQELKLRQSHEVEEMRQDLIDMTKQLTKMQDVLQNKDKLCHQLRDQVLELKQDLEAERNKKDTMLEEHKKTFQNLRRETDSAMVQLRESLFLEKQKTVETLRDEIEQDRRDIAGRAEERLHQQKADHDALIKSKTSEIDQLVKLVNKLEREQTTDRNRIQDEIKMQVHEAVAREREILEKEREWMLRQERENLQVEHRHQLKQVQDEASNARRQKDSFENKLKEIKDELDDVRSASKQNVHEKLIAVARAKELMRQEQQAEIDRIRDQMKNEHKLEIEKLRETTHIQEEELRQLRGDRHKWIREQRETGHVLDKTERTLVNEINDECRRTSEILGLSPRKVSINSYRGDNGYSPVTINGMGPMQMTKTPTTSALGIPSEPLFLYSHAQQANLRACNEELRKHVQELGRDVEVHRSALYNADLEKDEALSNLKKQLEREKAQEMEKLKEKLVKGMSTNEYRGMMYNPDNDLSKLRQMHLSKGVGGHTRHMSDGQQYEIARLEQEIKKLAMNQREMLGKQSPTVEDLNYSKSLQQLQAKVKQLQEENNTLRRSKMSVSTPDLSNPGVYNSSSHLRFSSRSPTPSRDQERMASSLHVRMKEAEMDNDILSEVQKQNRGVMSNKMAEMSKLQNTLTNQAKDLIQLEKAYTQLNQYAKTPGRSTLT